MESVIVPSPVNLYRSAAGPRVNASVATMASRHALALTDVNRDRRADLIVAGETSDEVFVFLAR
jgi:hypothetical protein